MLFIAALLLCGTMQAQNYHWSYNYHDYESNFPLIGEVYINDEVVASSDFEIAAFVGDQVRATELLFEADPVNFPGHYYAWLGVAYNNAGETVIFKLYDHSTGTEYDNCSTTVVTNANGYGEMDDPVIIEFTVEEPISYGPEYPWVVSGGFENYMYLEAQIQINGVPVTNTNWEVGAFCGEECRGLGDADNWWVSPLDQSNILEIVVGGATGDLINFYLYDVTNQEVYPAICTVSLDWVDDDIGDMFDLFVLNFVTMQTFTMANDATDNAAIIEANHGKPANVTLSGRTLYKDGAWNTLTLPFDMTEEQVAAQLDPLELMELSNDVTETFNDHPTGVTDDGTLYLVFKDVTEITAGRPYIIKWEGDGSDNLVDPVFTGVTIDNASLEDNAVAFNGGKFIGNYSPITFEANDRSILFLGAANTLYWPSEVITFGAFRAYFQLSNSKQVRAFNLKFGQDGGQATGIISNGKLIIDNEDGWYSVDGRKLPNQPKRKGLYIHNGEKVVIK